jgi:OOP family OmpA-OmpF porin
MLKAMQSFTPMRVMAAAALAFAVSAPSAQDMSETYWYASGDPSVPNGQLWANSYGECYQSAAPDGPVNLPPCDVIPEEITVRLNFNFDKYVVPDEVVNTEELVKIDEYIDQLESTPENEIVTVVGHTDAKGSDEYNMALGQRRADAVRDYIIQRGYPAEHVAPAESRGKRELLADFDPFSVMQRRVVLTKTVQ